MDNNIILLYSGYFLAIFSSIIAYFQMRSKKKIELEKISLQKEINDETNKQKIRFEVYKEYLSKLDNINTKLFKNITSEEMKLGMSDLLEALLQNPDDQKPLKDYFLNIYSYYTDWSREQSRNLEELSGLRLVCSKEILALLDSYESIARSYIQDIRWLAENTNPFEKPDMNSPALISQKDNYTKLMDIKVKIEQQMRKDIGVG